MQIKVSKYDGRGKVIAQTAVATLAQAHAFLDAQPTEYPSVDVSPGTPVECAIAAAPSADESPVPG